VAICVAQEVIASLRLLRIGLILTRRSPKMEAVKGVIFDRGMKLGKYMTLVGMVILSDEPIARKSEEIIMGGSILEPISDSINDLKRYDTPYNLGTLDNAIVTVSNMTLEEAEQTNAENTIHSARPKRKRKVNTVQRNHGHHSKKK